jgi:hypothetical protein
LTRENDRKNAKKTLHGAFVARSKRLTKDGDKTDKQRQRQKQIPFGDDNQRDNGKRRDSSGKSNHIGNSKGYGHGNGDSTT